MLILGMTKFQGLKNVELENRIKDSISSLAFSEVQRFETENMLFFFSSLLHEQMIHHGSLFILGRSFRKDNFNKTAQHDVSGIQGSNLNLSEQYWGSFVKLVDVDGGIEVEIDQEGQSNFFYYGLSDGNYLFSTDISLITKSVTHKIDYDINYIATLVKIPEITTTRTLFKGISRLRFGSRIFLKKDRVTKINSSVETRKNLVLEENDAFVSTMCKVLQAWTSPYEKIYLQFSGGLDSSAILYCLNHINKNESSKQIFPINFFSSDTKGSIELMHATKITQELDIPLLTYDFNDCSMFSEPKDCDVLLNKPANGLISWNYHKEFYDIFGIDEKSLLLSGHGGDNLFMKDPAIESVIDAFVLQNVRMAHNSIKEICLIERGSYIRSLYKSIGLLLKYYFNMKMVNYYVRPLPDWFRNEMHELANLDHEDKLQQREILPGKASQLEAIYAGINSKNDCTPKGYQDVFYPLLSQPLIEFALAIPSHHLYNDGYDRIPVRKSIHKFFNTNNIWRKDKGNTTGKVLLGIRDNFNYVTELCMEGFLSRNKLINKDILYDRIKRLSAGESDNISGFVNLYSMEIFLYLWEKHSK